MLNWFVLHSCLWIVCFEFTCIIILYFTGGGGGGIKTKFLNTVSYSPPLLSLSLFKNKEPYFTGTVIEFFFFPPNIVIKSVSNRINEKVLLINELWYYIMISMRPVACRLICFKAIKFICCLKVSLKKVNLE